MNVMLKWIDDVLFNHYIETVELLPITVLIIGLFATVRFDAYMQKRQKRIMLLLCALVASLIIQTLSITEIDSNNGEYVYIYCDPIEIPAVDGVYQMTMPQLSLLPGPGVGILVSAAFTKDPEQSIFISEAICDGTVASDHETATAGTLITLTATPVEGCVLDTISCSTLSGTTETTFSPDGACTRAQAVTFLWRAAGSQTPSTTEDPFNDVGENVWYRDAVLWALENGITSGVSQTNFAPNMICTRAHAVTFLWRGLEDPR